MNTRVIDHEEATRNLMAERYLLGELTEEDRDSYEEHLFSCQDCFEQIKVGTELVSQIRQLGPDTADTMPGFMSRIIKNVSQPFTASVFALLICVSAFNVYQYKMIHGLRQAQITPSFFLSDGAKAGGVKKVVVSPNARFDLSIQLLQSGDFSSYEGRVLTESEQVKSSFPISAEQTKDTIHLLLDSGVLRSGNYLIVINGISADGSKSEVARYPFQIQVKE
jgi:hypothetical protein